MKLRQQIIEFLYITLGTLITAAAVNYFLVPSHLAVGSISGLAILLSEVLPLSVSTLTMIMNVALLVIGFLLLGPEFGIKTVYTSILLPFFMGILEKFAPIAESLTGDPFIDMVVYCFAVSVGLSMLFNRNASSGGLDIIAKILNKFFRIELGKAMSGVGMCVAVSAILVYDLKTVILSVFGTYVFGLVLDHFIFGSNIKKRVCIISKKEPEIRSYVLHELKSGATVYHAYGAYDEKQQNELIVIVNKQEYLKLMTFLNQNDPDAFVTVYNVNEVLYKPKK